MKCENPKDLLDHLRKKYAKNKEMYHLIIEENHSKFDQLYSFWASLEGMRKQKMLRGLLSQADGLQRFSMQIANKQDRGAGVVRNTFTEAIEDMIKTLFVRADNDPKANRYVVKTGTDVDKCKFAGELIAFCLLNEIPIPYRLSRSILVRFIYKPNEIDPDIDVMYLITDFTETSQMITNKLTFPEYVDPEELGQKGVDPEDQPEAFYQLVKDHVRATARTMATSSSVTALTQGFFLRNEARKHSWTVDRIDQLISGNAVDAASCKQLLEHLRLTRAPPVFLNMFENLVNKKDFAFIEKVMQYWSGLKKIDITLTPRYQAIEVSKGLPMASTCFNLLKIPKDVKSPDMLLERFRIAIENSGSSFGLD